MQYGGVHTYAKAVINTECFGLRPCIPYAICLPRLRVIEEQVADAQTQSLCNMRIHSSGSTGISRLQMPDARLHRKTASCEMMAPWLQYSSTGLDLLACFSQPSLNDLFVSFINPKPTVSHGLHISPLGSSWLNPNQPSYVSLELFILVAIFDTLRNLLESQLYSCTGQEPPSFTSKDHRTADLEADVKFYRNDVMLPLLEEGKDIVPVLHFYGGGSGGGAVQGLSKRERQAVGQRGGCRPRIHHSDVLACWHERAGKPWLKR